MTRQGISTVARQELKLRIRTGRWRWLLGIWFALLLVFTGLLTAALSNFSQAELTDRGVVLYGGLTLFVLGLALLVVPALAAQSVNGDRERGTLATLQVTRLTAGDIAIGKFAAAWGTSLVFLALTLPLVLYAISQGGVPVGRMLVVTLVLALLLGTVCAVSLALSSLLSRTTTSGVLAYLTVFALTLGTVIVFGLVTAVTTESYTTTYTPHCPTAAELQSELAPEERDRILGQCQEEPQTYTSSRARTDRTWWLLAPNPFVILADSAPSLPPETAAEQAQRQADQSRGINRQNARDLDPLGLLGKTVRDLRRPPTDNTAGGYVAYSPLTEQLAPEPERRRPVWPYGLAFDVLIAAGALLVTQRRLRTPTRTLATGRARRLVLEDRLGDRVEPVVRDHCLQGAQGRARVVAPVVEVGELPPPQRLGRAPGVEVTQPVHQVTGDLGEVVRERVRDELLLGVGVEDLDVGVHRAELVGQPNAQLVDVRQSRYDGLDVALEDHVRQRAELRTRHADPGHVEQQQRDRARTRFARGHGLDGLQERARVQCHVLRQLGVRHRPASVPRTHGRG